MQPAPLDVAALDLGHLALFVGMAFSAEVEKRNAPHTPGLRFSRGFLIQHLVGAERTIGELARRMGVSQQAASKTVAELERLGYLERAVSSGDARARTIRLSAAGRATVDRTRRSRAQLEKRLARKHGEKELARCRALLAEVLETLGGAEAVRQRKVALPR